MSRLVKIEIEVAPEVASMLQDDRRRSSVGRLVSRILKEDTEAAWSKLIGEIKRDARAAGLADEDIDAELAAYNAERRS